MVDPSTTNLYTIGYESAELSEVLRTLQEAAVDIVVDVREFPGSRRPGFSKTPLRQALSEAGIEYRHERALGAPREIRNRLREDKDYKSYFREFNVYLRTQTDLLKKLTADLQGKSFALLCYERNPEECHRSSVAAKISSFTGLEPHHLKSA